MAVRGNISIAVAGTTGHGKSSTINTLIAEDRFETSDEMSPKKLTFEQDRFDYDNYSVLVTEFPDLYIQMLNAGDKPILSGFDKFPDNVDIFLFVFKFGFRFTPEETERLSILEKMYGSRISDRLIIVITAKDFLIREIGESESELNRWLESNKTGEFGKWLKKCGNRWVFLNNAEKNKVKISRERKTLMKLIIQTLNSPCFKNITSLKYESGKSCKEFNRNGVNQNTKQTILSVHTFINQTKCDMYRYLD